MVQGVTPYDDQVAAERIIAVGDLYYIFQHEKIGVFRVVKKLQDLFRAGAVRLSDGDGAFRLYQFDRREVLRYTKRERQMAYRRAFGYGRAPVARDSRPNSDFHPLFAQFVNQVTLYWRDKRISDVIRERANDPGVRLDRRRPPRRPRPAKQPQVHVVRPSQRSARRGHADP